MRKNISDPTRSGWYRSVQRSVEMARNRDSERERERENVWETERYGRNKDKQLDEHWNYVFKYSQSLGVNNTRAQAISINIIISIRARAPTRMFRFVFARRKKNSSRKCYEIQKFTFRYLILFWRKICENIFVRTLIVGWEGNWFSMVSSIIFEISYQKMKIIVLTCAHGLQILNT